MGKIKMIEVVNPMASRQYHVGQEVNGRVIAEIRDYTSVWPDGIEVCFECVDESGVKIASIVNCPVVLEYE